MPIRLWKRLTDYNLSPFVIDTEIIESGDNWRFVVYEYKHDSSRSVLHEEEFDSFDLVILAETRFWENNATCEYFGEDPNERPIKRLLKPVCRKPLGECPYQRRRPEGVLCAYHHSSAALTGKPRPWLEKDMPREEVTIKDIFHL